MSFTSKASLNKDRLATENIDINLHIHSLITSSGIDNYKITILPNDVSKRIYYRVSTKNKNYIVMNATLEKDSLLPFIKIAEFLKKNNLRAPSIINKNLDAGFLLLEDFGTNSFNKTLAEHPDKETNLYTNAVEVLAQLYHVDIQNLDVEEHNSDLLNQGLQVFIDWYAKELIPKNKLSDASNEFFNIFNQLYSKITSKKVIALRDYHADNLMILDNNQIGLLDFQDARVSYPAYDLVSLLEDARRQVPLSLEQDMITKYLELLPEINKDDFLNSYYILGIQRNLRIIGLFHRLNKRDNNPKYTQFIPIVWSYVVHNIKQLILTDLFQWFNKYDLFPK